MGDLEGFPAGAYTSVVGYSRTLDCIGIRYAFVFAVVFDIPCSDQTSQTLELGDQTEIVI